MAGDQDAEQEARRLKAVAETKYKNSNLKSALKHAKKAQRVCPNLQGISSMLTAFKILRAASKPEPEPEPNAAAPDWYKILQVEPFSHINSIKKQYRKLALILHPDKNQFAGCEEAFKLVSEGFRVFSDKIRRKEYDMKLRIRLQEERIDDGLDGNGGVVGDTFWTACSRCRLLHKFESKYRGHNLVCPNCKKSFLAVEVDGEEGDDDDDDDDHGESTEEEEVVAAGVRVSQRLKTKLLSKASGETTKSAGLRRKVSGDDGNARKEAGGDESGVGRSRRRTSTVGEVLARSVAGKVKDGEMEERSRSKRVKVAEETMTLAEMQLEMKRKANQGREKVNIKEKAKDAGEREKDGERHEPPGNRVSKTEKHKPAEKSKDFESDSQGPPKMSQNMGIMTRSTKKKSLELEVKTREDGKKNQNSEITKQGTSRKRVKLDGDKRHGSKSGDIEVMDVEDLDFYDFGKDRLEKNFKKGQVWAIYDDDDGMPRHYGLIEEVFSVNPFELKMSWLEFQNKGDGRLIGWDKMGFRVSCGRFKVARKSFISAVNIFSHLVECERAAKEIYRIYPKKGSVWAFYNEDKSGAAGRNASARDKHCYDIVVLLTTYSDIHGLSMAYLEKVDGFRTIFKRQDIGCQSIRWLEKEDIQFFSHQIPARKLSGDDVPDLLKDCWELDSSSLPPDLLATGQER